MSKIKLNLKVLVSKIKCVIRKKFYLSKKLSTFFKFRNFLACKSVMIICMLYHSKLYLYKLRFPSNITFDIVTKIINSNNKFHNSQFTVPF